MEIKIGDYVFGQNENISFGGEVIMICSNYANSNKEFTVRLPCDIFIRTNQVTLR